MGLTSLWRAAVGAAALLVLASPPVSAREWRAASPLRGGRQLNRLVVDPRGRAVESCVDIAAGTCVAFRGTMSTRAAKMELEFSRPVRMIRPMDFMNAVPGGGQEASGVVRSAAGSLANRVMSLLPDDAIPVYMTRLTLALDRGADVVQHGTTCQAELRLGPLRLNRQLSTRLQIPLDRLCPQLPGDVSHIILDEPGRDCVASFLREAYRRRFFGPSLPAWARDLLASERR
jgi:hypothetical protein